MSTAAGLLTLWWLHGGGTSGRLDSFISLIFLSLGLGFASILPVRFHREGSGLVPMQALHKEPKSVRNLRRRAPHAFASSFSAIALGLGGRRLTLVLQEMMCFPPTHRVCCGPVRLCHSRCCARTSVFGLIRSITGKQQTTQGPSIPTWYHSCGSRTRV